MYRRCPCKGPDGKELGPRCPQLAADRKHGKWGFAVDVPTVTGKRKTMRRHQWTTKSAAQRALDDVLARHGAGITVDDAEWTADYLRGWLKGKRYRLKPKTAHQYAEYVHKDLIPALGAIRLERLRHEHVRGLGRVPWIMGRGRGARF